MEEFESEKGAGEQQPTFEEALAQLETIVHALEEGRLGLDQSLAQYEDGVKLLRRCHGLLERAERRIEMLGSIDAQGRGQTETVDDRAMSLDEKAQTRGRRRSKAARPEPAAGIDTQEGTIDDSGSLF
ncbi:MAG TPA: exodeoxyribonuclease VII small subunit [Pirellulales bacterium]|jgi:exodeoxyribonuclease VII small subunit|nr:exodeoxyribonuclease VII small subunit [Pirellulales bacterium]